MNELLASPPAISGDKTVSLISTRNTSGTWEIPVTPMVPLMITYSFSGSALGKETYANLIVLDGSTYSKGTQAVLGALSGYIRGNDLTIIPNSNTVSINVVAISSTITLYAFQ